MPKRKPKMMPPEQKLRFAHTYALMALEELVELDPRKRSLAGRLLSQMATAVSRYEGLKYPITKDQKKRAKSLALPPY